MFPPRRCLIFCGTAHTWMSKRKRTVSITGLFPNSLPNTLTGLPSHTCSIVSHLPLPLFSVFLIMDLKGEFTYFHQESSRAFVAHFGPFWPPLSRFFLSFGRVMYRVIIKYYVFPAVFKIFRTLAFLCFPSVSVCVHTPGR